MRFLWVLLVVKTLSADYLVTIPGTPTQSYCATDYYYSGGDIYYRLSSSGVYETASNAEIQSGFDYNATCQKKSYLETSGLTFEDWNYLMALAGLLVGFTFLFWASFLVIKVGGR